MEHLPGAWRDGEPGLGDGPGSPASPSTRHRQRRLVAIRRVLDSGMPFPDFLDPHDAAAALLAFFAELPNPFLPQDLVQVCDVCLPTASTAASLLLESMSAAEVAVLCHLLLLMREALAPENRAHNGLSPHSLAAILAEFWFPGIPPPPTGGRALAAERKPAPPSSVAEISMRRIEFVQLLLEDRSLLETLCASL